MDVDDNNCVVLIATFGYTRRSAGIHAQHLLCHELRERGWNAFLVFINGDNLTNSKWDTPIWNGTDSKVKSIAIYSELITNNPLKANHSIRWILGDFYAHPKIEAPGQTFFYWHASNSSQLRLNLTDRLIEMGSTESRNGIVIYYGKKRGWLPIGLNDPYLAIYRFGKRALTRKQVLETLQKSAALIVAEDSLIIEESILAGCPVILTPKTVVPDYLKKIPSVYFQKHDYDWPEMSELLKQNVESRETLIEISGKFTISLNNFTSYLKDLSLKIEASKPPLKQFGPVSKLFIYYKRIRAAYRSNKFCGLGTFAIDSVQSRIKQ